MSPKWKSSIPVAAFAAAAALAFPGIASAEVDASVALGVLTVTGEDGDAITISCDAGGDVAVADADPPLPATPCTTITAIDVTGGAGANVITLTGVTADGLRHPRPGRRSTPARATTRSSAASASTRCTAKPATIRSSATTTPPAPATCSRARTATTS